MKYTLTFYLSTLIFYCAGNSQSQAPGIYALWYTKKTLALLELPYIQGGQVHAQWADIDKEEIYNWKTLDDQFASSKFISVTVQVNGNTKPTHLFDKVPFIKNWETHQIGSAQDILMYWHPNFISAYRNFLHIYAEYLKNTPFRSSLLGIRFNFNAIGTEHFGVPPHYRDASLWTTPVGVHPGIDWSLAQRDHYAKAVLDAHIKEFVHTDIPIFVFVRSNLRHSIRQMQAPALPVGSTYADYFYQGTLGWFHTSSDVEPQNERVAYKFKTYFDFCRPGYTLGYTECAGTAWGYTALRRNLRWCTPPQWIYWRLLSDLHLGISFIGVHHHDLIVAQTGAQIDGTFVGNDYQQEFDMALRFAAKYAGYHAKPAQSPGAWIAFRQSIKPLGDYSKLITDYNMHIVLLNPQDTIGLDARRDGEPVPEIEHRTEAWHRSIGPYNARYGAWARKIPQNKSALLKVKNKFVQQLNKVNTAQIRITYLDNITGSFILSFGNQSPKVSLTNSGRWKTAVIPVKSVLKADTAGAHIKITSTNVDIIVHMVEITKAT